MTKRSIKGKRGEPKHQAVVELFAIAKDAETLW